MYMPHASLPCFPLFAPCSTSFMKRASESIIDYCRVKLEGDRRLRNVRFFISGSEAPGEGEVKLMDWINSYVRSPQEVRGPYVRDEGEGG